MKKGILSLIAIILLLSICINALAYCESYNLTGKHMNASYISDVHTSQGHAYGYECQDCGLITIIGYKSLSTCCRCTGNHNYYTYSVGGHTSRGHLVTLKCLNCGYTTSYYDIDYSCCQCVGHTADPMQISSYHTPGLGHYYTVTCKECGDIIESGYTTLWSCSTCNCSHVYITEVSDYHTPGLGHYYTRYCYKCGNVADSGYTTESDCCECRGYHNYYYSVSDTHTSYGHLVTQSCVDCGHVEYYYTTIPTCCYCRGYHNYTYTVSSEHTPNGHLKTGICSDCGHVTTSYVTLPECCQCKGYHDFSQWSEVSSVHEAQGHRQTRTCKDCGYTETRFTTYRPCCLCHGHDMQRTSNIGEHTDFGHAVVYRCITCGYEETVYEDIFGCPLCSNTPTNQEEFILWIQHLGIPVKSINGNYTVSFTMYRDYGYIVYGNPYNVANNPCVAGEYQFLGYTYDEDLFTNISYQNTEMGPVNANQWIYTDISGATESWDRLESTVQKPYMLHTNLIGHGAVNFTANDIGMNKTRVQNGASWLSTGSIYTYKTNGYYATFKVPSMGTPDVSLNACFTQERLVYSDTDVYKKGYVNVSFSVDKPLQEIEYIKLSVQGGNSITLQPHERSGQLELNIPIQYIMPAKYTVRVLIEVKSIFNDVYITGDYCSVDLYKEEAPYNPANPVVPEEIISDEPEDIPYEEPDESEYDVLITDVSLTGSWNIWNLNERFTGLEEIQLELSVAGRVTDISVIFSEELKSWTYEDGYGNTYDYADLLGSYDMCPKDMNIEGLWNNGYTLTKSYILPLCLDTIDTEGNRIKDKYTITVIAKNEKKEHIKEYMIDITGNIYDYLYVQP